MKQQSPQFKRKRKMLLFLPVIVLPFTTFLFWSLGGGRNAYAGTDPLKKSGLNFNLPNAQLSNGATDKLSLYQQALKDSVQLEEERRTDPYSQSDSDSNLMPDMQSGNYEPDNFSGPPSANSYYHYEDPNERKVQERLAALQRRLQQPEAYRYAEQQQNYPDNAQMQRVQNAVNNLQNLPSGNNDDGDPDVDKINAMLQKVIDIQHPDAARERLEAESTRHRGQMFSIEAPKENRLGDLFSAQSTADSLPHSDITTVGFYESGGSPADDQQDDKAVPAVVNETQTLVSGSTVKMRLTQHVFINGTEIPKGTFVFGVCQLEGERLKVAVKTIRYQDNLFPVALTVYDLDGLPGIKIPGAITRDAAKDGLDQGIQAVNMMSMDESLGAQAASAGIQATKSLLSHKAKLVRATVKAGYPVLLADDNKKNHPN